MVRECENCGRIIKGAGRKYCSYCRNSAEVRNKREENYSYEGLDYLPQKRELNWKPFFVLLFIGLAVASFFILSNNGKENLNIISNSTNNYSKIIQIHSFYGQSYSNSPACKTSFVIENTIDKEVKFRFYYDILYYNHVGILQRIPKEINLSLHSLEKQTISDESGIWGYHNCLIDQGSIKIIYQPTSQLKCSGETCLKDGEFCSSNSECGSGICNIAGFCGTEKITECPTGFQNCNNESCLEIRTKKVGEKYSCEFECKTNYGEEGICKTPLSEKISKGVFILSFLLIFAFVVYIILSDRKLIEIVRGLKDD